MAKRGPDQGGSVNAVRQAVRLNRGRAAAETGDRPLRNWTLDTSTPHLSLVVVTHNCVAFLPGFFASWFEAVRRCPVLGRPPMVVADSGSTDDTPERAYFLAEGAAELVSLDNIGYGAAANAGIAETTTPYVLLCNADLTFSANFGTDFLGPLVLGIPAPAPAPSEIPDSVPPPPPTPPENAAVFAPCLLNADGSRQPSIGRWPTITGLVADQFRPRAKRKYVRVAPPSPAVIAWASGACLLLKRQAFVDVGGFDPRFFLYVEEVDLQYRMKQAGYSVYYVPQGTVVHHSPNAERAPRAEIQRYAARGLLRYFALHHPWRLPGYRALAWASGRLGAGEALAPRSRVMARATGP